MSVGRSNRRKALKGLGLPAAAFATTVLVSGAAVARPLCDTPSCVNATEPATTNRHPTPTTENTPSLVNYMTLGGAGTVVRDVPGGALLQENGSYVLLEDGGRILL